MNQVFLASGRKKAVSLFYGAAPPIFFAISKYKEKRLSL